MEDSNALAIQFDVAEGFNSELVKKAVSSYLKERGHSISFTPGEKLDWVGFIRSADRVELAGLADETQRFLTDLGGVTFQSVFLTHVADAFRRPLVIEVGPRQRPSGLAERAS